MGFKKGKRVGSTGLTPAAKSLTINKGSPDESNKENIPPSSCTRSSKRDATRALFDKTADSPSSSTRRKSTSAKPGKRGSSPASDQRRDDATPTKKSPGRPRRDAADAAFAQIAAYHADESPQPSGRGRKNVLEVDNVDLDEMDTTTSVARTRGAAAKSTSGQSKTNLPHFSSKNGWRQMTPDDESDEDDEDEQYRQSSSVQQQSTPSRRSTRRGSIGRNEKELRKSPIERKLTNPSVRAPSMGREASKLPARTMTTRVTPGRNTVSFEKADEVSSSLSYTPRLAINTGLKLPKADLKIVVKREGDKWRQRSMDTPSTVGRPVRTARIVKRDEDYKPPDVNIEESDDQEESENSSESGSEGEEEEEERPRRNASRGRKSIGRSCSRPAAKAARSGTRRVIGGFRLEEEEEVKIDLRKAPTNLAAALDRLAMYRCPRGTLLCRETECAQIKEFIKAAIAPKGISQACYISGVPGTGKTASVMSMVNELARSASPSHPFIFIQVNSMYFSDPKQVFAEVYYAYAKQTGEEKVRRLAGTTARKRLNEMFERVDRSRPPVLMLIDELDQLATKKQELIYDIFNWTSLEDARVSIISIANTLDLPERMLNQRICSRLGMNRIVFQPYSHEEIEKIIASKLGGSKTNRDESVIEADAVQLAARKVAAISGDLRKATDILRTAIEKAIVKGEKKLTMMQVNESIRSASSTLLVHAVCSLPLHQMVVFEAAVDIVRTRDVEDFSMFDLMEKYEAIARLAHEREPLNDDAVYGFVLQLSASALIAFTNPNEKFRFRRRLRLVPAMHDAVSAIKIATDKKKAKTATVV